jgi:DNA repair protein RadC
MAGIHDGHRERLRQRFSEHGPDVFADHELLELLLTYAIPRRDTNETAHKLLQRFGSLAGVFAADAASLQTVDGVGPAAAQLLQLEAAIRRRIALSGVPHRNGKPLLNAPHRAARYAELLLSQETDERMYALCLNAQRALLCAVAVGSGSVSELTVYPRTIVELAILRHAHGIILAHNHPSGDPLPSQPDIETTEAIRAALQSVHVGLLDHIIVGDGYLYSFSAQAVLRLAGDRAEVLSTEDYGLSRAQQVAAARIVSEEYGRT